MSDVRIQDDLYEAVNGEWLKTAVIPDDKPRTGGFSLLDEGVEKLMMEDFREFSEGKKHSDITGMEDAVRLYRLALDSERRNKEGIKPVEEYLKMIDGLKGFADVNDSARQLMECGVDLPVEFGVETDMKDATKNSFIVQGPAIILPDTTYYGTERGDALLGVYKDMASKILAHTSLSKEDQDKYLEDTLAYDGMISKTVKSQVEWADYVKNYNPTSLDEVDKNISPFSLRRLLNDIYGDILPETVIVYDPRAIKEAGTYLKEENFELYKHWAYVKFLIRKCARLSEELYELCTLYRRTLTGVAGLPTVEKRAYQVASSMFSEPVGIYYGRTYFGEEAKKDIVDLVHKIIKTYQRRVKENTFLKESTKETAIKKLSAMAVKMGYPDEVREIYQKMKVDENDSYFTAMEKLNKVTLNHHLEKLNKPVDRSEWMMPGHMVNACYDPNRNDITFPAAILQKPFYALSQSVSENLGGIGAVIGHEISHAFDNNGSHFDENGNLKDWWTKEDFEAFDKLTKDMIRQWDGIEYCGGRVNGELVVSENIADNGGMAVTLDIMSHTEGADYKQYFMNWARVWCMKAREEYIQLLLKNDVHSPAKLRANIPVRNFPEWYETFGVTSSDQMYIAPEDRIVIW